VPELPLVALAGNPNVGKTSIFNRLTGGSQKVGNYPGITVERHSGKLRLPSGGEAVITDVPGTYSLSARSAEEQLASLAVVGLPPLERPDLVVVVVDATQLLRNLYLALQVVETGVPTVVALSMTDLLARSGQRVDVERLAAELGTPVVPVSGLSGAGTDELLKTVGQVLAGERPAPGPAPWTSGPSLEEDLDAVGAVLPPHWANGSPRRQRALACWALLSVDEDDELQGVPDELRERVHARRAHASTTERDIEAEIIRARYGWIDEHGATALVDASPAKPSATARLDSVLLHPVAGFGLFLLLMGLVFQSLFSWSDPAIGWIEGVFAWLSDGVVAVMPEGLLRDFITEGLVAGVGGVVVFLPQILLLFFFIGLMEDCGYMARVAFLMDRIMKAIGLHGRAFVPMMSGFACAVPAILATRTMERRRDRMVTMMVVPLMSCSARLPVYTLLIAALFDTEATFLGFLPVQSSLMVAMYVFSTLVALAAAAVLGRTLFKGPRVPLILELPPYRMPQLGSVVRMMLSRGGIFLRQAGGVILVCTIALWALLSFPGNPELETDYAQLEATATATLSGAELDAELERIGSERSRDVLRNSYGGRMGRTFEPVIEPLGFDWKIGVGLIGAFAAREVFVSTMGVVYGVSDDVDEESESLRESLRREEWPDGSAVYTPLVGLSLMVFIALACQCMSTLAAVYRETSSWRWPLFLFAYMTALAWLASLVVYQGGRWLGFD